MLLIKKFMFPIPPKSYDKQHPNLYYIKGELKKKKQIFIPIFWIQSLHPSEQVLIYFHANYADNGECVEICEILSECLKIHVLIMEYPGYGLYSSSKPSEKKICSDSLHVYDFLVQEMNFQPENILVMGRSLGGVPATYLAGQRKIQMLILLSPFSSVKSIIKDKFKILAGLFKECFDNLKNIKEVHQPVLLIHGLKDKIIKFTHSERLHNACPSEQKLIVFPEEMTHNKFDLYKDVIVEIKGFQQSIQKGQGMYYLNREAFQSQLQLTQEINFEILSIVSKQKIEIESSVNQFIIK